MSLRSFTITDDGTNKVEAIVNGEYALSKVTLGAPQKWNIGSMLVEHYGVDFRDEGNWECNALRHPSREGTYGPGMSIGPLEVIFHKGKWASEKPMDLYSKWIEEHYQEREREEQQEEKEHGHYYEEREQLEQEKQGV